MAPYILTVANTYPHKNIHTLVEAFGKISGHVRHDLIIVGLPRRGEGRVARAISRLPDPARVVRRSRLSPEALAALYRGADLFVFPSLYEGFGLPVLEAMTAGIPVVTTRMGAIPEVGGQWVTYADPPDAAGFSALILHALKDGDARHQHGVERARARALEFTWEKTAAETLGVLRGEAAARRHGP